MWLHHEGFKPLLQSFWAEPTHSSNPALRLIKKLKKLKARLRDWNLQVFRKVFEEIDNAYADLDAIQNDIATNGDSDASFNIEMNYLNRVITFWPGDMPSSLNVIDSSG